MRCDFNVSDVLNKPLMAHLSTTDKGEPRDSPVWFLWEDDCIWVFGTDKDSFVQRLSKDPRCAVGVVDFDLDKGILKHVGVRGLATINMVDKGRLNRFVAKYLGSDISARNDWFMTNVVLPLNAMVKVIPNSVVAKNVSFFKTGPGLAE